MAPRPHVDDTGIECIWSRWTYTVHASVERTYRTRAGIDYTGPTPRCWANINLAGAVTGVDEHRVSGIKPCPKCFRGTSN